MKRLLILTNAAWLLIFVVVFFRCCKSEPSTKDCQTISSNYTEVTERHGRLTLDEAKNMADLYHINHFPVPNENMKLYSGDTTNGEVDARSVWFSLETLKQFLWDIESTSATCKGGCETLNLGVRIYYGEYPVPADPKDTSFPASDKKRHTVFMVPTYSKKDINGKTRDFDFNPRVVTYNGKGSSCAPITLQELVEARPKKKTAQNSNTAKFTFASLDLPIETLLEDKFILSPHPESLVKTIAAENMPLIEGNGKDKNPKGGGKGDTKTPKDTNKKQGKKVLFNSFAPPQSSGDYMFQNHGTMCPPYCNGEDYFAQ